MEKPKRKTQRESASARINATIVNRSVIVAFAAVTAIIYYLFPWSGDDVWYSVHLADWLEGRDTSFIPWQAIADTWEEHYLYDNIRMGDNILPFMLIMPKWISAIALGLCAGAMLIFASRLVNAGSNSPLRLATVTLLLTFFLPWHENMFCLAYGVNYVVSSALTLYVLYKFLLEKDPHPGRTVSMAALLGLWHEGFAVPLIIALSAACIICRMSSRRRWWTIAAIVPGALILWLSPGLAGNTNHMFAQLNPYNILITIKSNIPFLIWAVTCFIALWKHPEARRGEAPWIIVMLTVAAIVCYINFHIIRGERVSWLLIMLSLIGIARSLFILWPGTHHKRAQSLAAGAIYLIIAIHFGAAISVTAQQRKAMDEAVEHLRNHPDEPAFTDMRLVYQMPVMAWRKPCSMLWERNKQEMRVRYFRLPEDWHALRLPGAILPEALRDLRPGAGTPVPGSAGIREKDGYYYMEGTFTGPWQLYVDYGIFTKLLPVEPIEFTASDSRTYTHIMISSYYFPYFTLRPRALHSADPSHQHEHAAER